MPCKSPSEAVPESTVFGICQTAVSPVINPERNRQSPVFVFSHSLQRVLVNGSVLNDYYEVSLRICAPSLEWSDTLSS